ncbi:serum response factor-binding protein 1 [Linepithema humile]|uniref:serum response factor-binding protein 1 n=1 Tax=Linepithema humile TaxID=83485 RepID=UPI00062307B5|nr:PREDICTED: serum response factor-binding protein 1-like [Linepithema humile]
MAKAELNNEIVLLRHAVRQARICMVNKLVKEAKNLRNRNGNEAQLEKNKRKADKLIAEVYALKTIKDDDISKFGILNERGLTEILQDQSSSHGFRITARVAYYKNLHRRIMQVRDRFPDYKKYLTEEKKKSTKLKNKDAAKTKKSSKENSPRTRNKNSEKQKVKSDKNIDYSQHNSTSEDEESCSTELPEAENNSCKRKKSLSKDNTSLKKQKLTELKEDSTSEDTDVDKQSNLIKPCNITKEATVKRFTELIKEEESSIDAQTTAESLNPAGTANDQAKVVDNFFLTEDNEDYQGSSISASTSYAKPHKHNTRTKSLQFSDRGKKENAKYKNNVDLKKYPAERSSAARPEKRTTNKITKRTNKSNPNDVSNKKENADVHPSWLAKRKEQEVIKQGFQGKKIVFTDD